MSLQWNFIAGFLYVEIGLVIILVLPIVDPRKWQRIFNSNIIGRVTQYSAMYFYLLLSVLTLFLVDAVKDMRKHSHPTENVNYGTEMKNSIKLFRSQRNFYITFFAIFLSFVLRRLMSMIDIQASLLNKSEAIIKEAEAAKDLACKTVQDHENLLILEQNTQKEVAKILQEQIDQLTEDSKMSQENFNILSRKYEEALKELELVKEKQSLDH